MKKGRSESAALIGVLARNPMAFAIVAASFA
jgi:hypothetical protein